ncbi:glycosyltransferase, partial [Azospirillum sp. ROY-1-1-2]|nr:glycosyltransferase [Azospirillum oleiclasticum]
ARTLLDTARPGDAADALRRAVALEPGRADLLLDLAATAGRAQRTADAAAALDHALALEPGNAAALGQSVQQRLRLCAWDGLAEREAALLAALRAGAAGVPPFALLGMDSSPADQRLAAERWAEQRTAGVTPVGRVPAVPGDGRIRIGYLSGDFHEHAVAHLIAELLERHDRGRFAVTAWSTGIDDGSAMRRRLMAAVERFEDLSTLSDADAARRIAGAGTDILVDLTGYTAFARTAIPAARPAPVQVNWLGYPGTMGAPFIDAIIADAATIPPEDEPHYSESVVRLPHSYQPNDRQRAIAAETPPRAALGLPEDGFVFCCFNSPYKIRPAVFDVWARLLHAVPGSVLWLYAAEPLVCGNLGREAVRRGLDPRRLVYAPPLPSAQHLARHRAADLFLDTLPYNAHTTGSDSLWAGLPMVTCRGAAFAGRVAAGLLGAAGLPELVADDLAGYEALALALARDPNRLAALRERLAAQRDTCPLFDSARFARDLEAVYTRLHEEHRRRAALRFAGTPAG